MGVETPKYNQFLVVVENNMWRFILNFKKQTEQNHKFLFWGFGYAQICHQGRRDLMQPVLQPPEDEWILRRIFRLQSIAICREVANGKSKPKI